MQNLAMPALVFLLLTTTTASQVRDLAPSPLEAFAARPTAKLIWSKAIGELDNPPARGVITAVAFEDLTGTRQVMRGLRIDLAHLGPMPSCDLRWESHAILCARPNAAIYYDEDSLERLRVHVARGWGEELIISFRSGGSGNERVGLIIGGHTFNHLQSETLVSLIDLAVLELKNAPR